MTQDAVELLDVQDLADALLASYGDAVVAGRIAVVTVESPTGWGKSDAVCRFFAALHETHDDTGYWPDELEGGRHDLHPVLCRPQPAAVMPYLWWAVRGQLDSVGGDVVARSAALDSDWQLRLLASPVAAALDRYDKRWRARLGVASTLAGLVLPSLGSLPRLVEQALQVNEKYEQLSDWREAAERAGDVVGATMGGVRRAMTAPASREPIRTDRAAEAAGAWRQAASLFAQVSRVVPIVIAVEDAQLLDESTVRLLDSVRQLDAVGMIVLTISSDRLAPDDRLSGWLSQLEDDALTRLALTPLPVDELERIAWERLSAEYSAARNDPDAGVRLLATTVGGSVLLLHQLLDLPAVARAAVDGQLQSLDDAVLRVASADDGRQHTWTTLGEPQRRGLAVASILGLVTATGWLAATLERVGGCAEVATLSRTGWATDVDGVFALVDAAARATLSELRVTVLTADEVAAARAVLLERIENEHRGGTWALRPLGLRLEALRAATDGVPLDESTHPLALELVQLQGSTGQSALYQRRAVQYLLPAATDPRFATTAVSVLAAGLIDIGERAEAIALLQKRLAEVREDPRCAAEAVLCRHELARTLQADGQLAAAIDHLEQVVAAREGVRPFEPALLDAAQGDLFACLGAVGRWAQAYDLAAARYAALCGPSGKPRNRITIQWGMRRFSAARALRRTDEAAAGFADLIRAARSICPPTDQLVLRLRFEAARTQLNRPTRHDRVAAIAASTRLCADVQLAWGDYDPLLFTSRNLLATAYREDGRPANAISLLEKLLADVGAGFGDRHEHTLEIRNNLALAYREAGRPSEAIPLLEQTVAGFTETLGRLHPTTLVSRNNLGVAYRRAGRVADCVPLSEDTLVDFVEILGELAPGTLNSRHNLALAYQDAGRVAEAVALLEHTLTDRVDVLGQDDPATLTCRHNLAFAYWLEGRRDEAIPLLQETLTARETVLGQGHPETVITRDTLLAVQRGVQPALRPGQNSTR